MIVSDCFGAVNNVGYTIDVNRYNLTDDTDVTSFEMCPTEKGIGCDIDTHAFVVRHEGFNLNFPDVFSDNDYALVFLPKAIDDIDPIKLNTNPNIPAAGDTLEVSGWGLVLGSATVVPDVPRAADMTYITSSECADILGGPITSQMLCADEDGRSACSGDSGMYLSHPPLDLQISFDSHTLG